MKNQYSFRLTTTLLPSDNSAKTTQVINKVDSDGNKFYPNFTEETVVITNDDRTIMETTRATCTDGVLTFVKRGLSDDSSATQIANRKLTWNPGSICFVTAGASDWIDRDDDMTWAGKQTYAGDAEYRGKATYKGRLITEKGVEYPHFDSLEELQAYSSPFGGMFAVVDADGELYRYNAETETWSVVTTSTPAQPAKASEEAIGTVRVATDAEFAAGTEQGSNDEFLMATVPQIKANIPNMDINYTEIKSWSDEIATSGQSSTKTYTPTKDGWLMVKWQDEIYQGKQVSEMNVSGSLWGNNMLMPGTSFYKTSSSNYGSLTLHVPHYEYLPVKAGQTVTITQTILNDSSFSGATSGQQQFCIWGFFYYG